MIMTATSLHFALVALFAAFAMKHAVNGERDCMISTEPFSVRFVAAIKT
jgi:hypothetical protein